MKLKDILNKSNKKNPINERMNSATYKRMDGLHHVRNMKSAMNFLADIATELEDEGFDADEIYEFFMMKIKRNIT